MNPIYDNGGCLGAKINITNVSLGDMTVALAPKTSALSTDVVIPNINVRLSASFKVACIGGSTTITLKASKAKIHGDLAARIASGKIVTSLPNASVAFEGFSLDVGGVPGAIESLLKDQARGAVEKLLTGQIKSKVPPLADKARPRAWSRDRTGQWRAAWRRGRPDSVSITATEPFVGLA